MQNRKSTLAIAMAALVLPAAASATNGYQLIGIGAYQKSLAGAVTANPGHSAMTAVTNPAGSARVGARTDFSMEMFMPKRDVDFTAMYGDKEDSAVNMYGVPAIGWTAPVSDGSNVYFGGGMYGTSGMGVDYAQVMMAPMFPPAGITDPVFWDGYSSVSFWQMAPTVAWNDGDDLSFGVALNIDYQAAAFKQRVVADTSPTPTVISNFDLSRPASSFGLGLTVGVLYDVNDKVTVGASYKSKQEFAPLEYQLAAGDITDPETGAPLEGGKYKLDLDFPQQLAVGIAVQAAEQWHVSADIKWINWSDTMKKLKVDGPADNDVAMDPGWDDQMVYAVGVSYLLSEHVNVRVGYNYAAAPFDAKDVSHNLVLPAITETHYTLGMDYHFNNHWDFAWHYMHAPKVTMTAPLTDPAAPGAKISLSETSFGINIGYRF